MRASLVGVTALVVFLVPIGWHLGYQSIGSYLLFWVSCALVLLSAVALARAGVAWRGWPDALTRIAVLAFAITVFVGAILGAAGLVTPLWYIVVLAVIFALVCRLSARRVVRPTALRVEALPVGTAAVLAALLMFLVAYGATHAPLTQYDSLSYHLFFPGRWLQDHRLSIIPTPFSDEAQAYAPINGELFFLWLMIPFHGDLLARIGQLPFALLGAVALYALARRLGAGREAAVYPPLFFLLSRPIVEQAVGANVDLVCASMFLAALYFGIVAVDRGKPADWVLFGVGAGLFAGSKYVALVYTPLLLTFPGVWLWRVARAHVKVRRRSASGASTGGARRLLWALPGLAAFAVPWYARNWIVAGSPIYPASLTVAGLTIAQGAFSRTAMLNTIFHTDDLHLFPVILARAFGTTLFVVWIPVALVGGIRMARRGWWPNGLLVFLPIAMALLHWFAFPVNIDPRFLMPAIAPALLPFAFTFDAPGVWRAIVRSLYGAAVVWILVGVHAQIPAAVPWFMGGWLALDGLVPRSFLVWFGAAAAMMGVLWRVGTPRRAWIAAAGVACWAVAVIALTIGADRWCRPGQCNYLDTSSAFIRTNYLASWDWLSSHVQDATVAYTGINLPYPLSGPRLTNRVVYVNLDGHDHWRFHDYDHAYRSLAVVPKPPILATSSGELEPAPQRAGANPDAVRPRYERMEGAPNLWKLSLRRSNADYLYVAALSAYEIDNVWHNDAGFPIEDEWAKSDPAMFRLAYQNPQVHVYAVMPAARPRA